jgi:hypothetical protein
LAISNPSLAIKISGEIATDQIGMDEAKKGSRNALYHSLSVG